MVGICERCGVEFDASNFLPGAPCIDCQDWVEAPEYGWLKLNVRWKQQIAQQAAIRDSMITDFVSKGYGIKAIGRIVGMDGAMVSRAVKRLNLQLTTVPKLVEYDVNELDKQTRMRRNREK